MRLTHGNRRVSLIRNQGRGLKQYTRFYTEVVDARGLKVCLLVVAARQRYPSTTQVGSSGSGEKVSRSRAGALCAQAAGAGRFGERRTSDLRPAGAPGLLTPTCSHHRRARSSGLHGDDAAAARARRLRAPLNQWAGGRSTRTPSARVCAKRRQQQGAVTGPERAAWKIWRI